MNNPTPYHLTTLPPTANFHFSDWSSATRAVAELQDAGYEITHNINTVIPAQWTPAPLPAPELAPTEVIPDPTFNRDEARFVELARRSPAKLDIFDQVLTEQLPTPDPTFNRDEKHVRALTAQQRELLLVGLESFENERTDRAYAAETAQRAYGLYRGPK